VQLIISLFSNFFSSVRHLANHRNGCFLILPDLMVRNYRDETNWGKWNAICSTGRKFQLERSTTFTFLLLFRPVTNQQTSNQKHLYYAEYSNASSVWNFCGSFLRIPSSDGDPVVVSWVGRKKKVRDIFQARGSSAHARKRFVAPFLQTQWLPLDL